MIMNSRPRISVIVPVYNVEKYLNRCIESIVNQTYDNLEIILVDDGAKDCSGALCDVWAKRDNRIEVVHKENAGLGMARNTGMEYCNGEYVAFIDSDDFVEHDMFEKMVAAIEESHADTCYCTHYIYSNKTKRPLKKGIVSSGVCTGTDALLDILGAEPESTRDWKLDMSVWAVLFSLKKIKDNNILFQSEREYLSEDLPFDVQYLSVAKCVVIIDEPLYNYCINDESLTHKYRADRFDKEVFLYSEIRRMISKYSLLSEKDYLTRYNKLFLGRIRSCIIQETQISGNSFFCTLRAIRKIENSPVVREIMQNYPYLKNPFRQRIFNLFLRFKCTLGLYVLAVTRKTML